MLGQGSALLASPDLCLSDSCPPLYSQLHNSQGRLSHLLGAKSLACTSVVFSGCIAVISRLSEALLATSLPPLPRPMTASNCFGHSTELAVIFPSGPSPTFSQLPHSIGHMHTPLLQCVLPLSNRMHWEHQPGTSTACSTCPLHCFCSNFLSSRLAPPNPLSL